MQASFTAILKSFIMLLVVSVLFVVISPQKALAISDIFPDPSTMDDANAVAARRGGSFQLDATTVAFRIFIPVTYNGNVRVAIHDACNNYTYGDWRTEFGIYTGAAAEEPISGPTTRFDTANCGNTSNGSPGFVCSSFPENRCLNVNTSSLTRSNIQGHTNYYTFVLKADHIGSGGGINGFKIEVINPSSSAVVTFRDLYTRDAWNGGGLTEVNSHQEPESFNSFAVLDEAFPGSGEDSYRFTFAGACDYTASTAFIKWSDADVGAGNEDGDISFRLINLRTGNPVSLRIYNASGSVLASGVTTVSGSLIGGENVYRAARFNIAPNTNYRWVWSNVQDQNGVQLWMPFNEINQQQTCNTRPNIQSSPSCSAVTGRYREPDGSTTIQARMSLADGSNVTTRTINVPASSSWRNFSIPVPNSVKSGFQNTRFHWVRIADNGGPGYVYASGFAPDPQRDCGTAWNYETSLARVTSDPATGPKPGANLTIRARTTNTGDGIGRAYTQRFRVTQGAAHVVNPDVVNYSKSRIGTGNSRNQAHTYRLRNDVPHNERICFDTRIRPFSGQSTPTSTVTSSGWRDSNEICYTIYNQRFELENSPNIGFNPTSAGAGETVTVSYSINNSDATELNADYPNTITGPTPNLLVRTRVTTGNASVTSGNANSNTGQVNWGGSYQDDVTIEIDNDASVGDNVCVRVFVNREQGYSDGTGLANNPAVDDTRCFNVSDGPYLQVLGHDTWAGGGYSLGGSCTVSGAGNILSNARPSLTSSGGAGALDQYAAFAEGSVSDFGTANDALTDTLTFANDSTLGNFGADRCLANLFDSGGAGGNVDDGLWNSDGTSDINNSFNGFGRGSEGQYKIDGQSSWNNNGVPFGGSGFSGNATVLINGNFEIRNDIKLNTSNLGNNIPFLVFIVAGDIRIESDVNQLDGIYIALGQIDTCNRFGGGSLSPIIDLTADGDCNGHLEVNGALIANDIAFRRTHGGTNEAATRNNLDRCLGISPTSPYYYNENRSCAGETIIFHSWFWLADPYFDRGGGPEANQYPIQQLRDLPPIF